MLDINKMTDNDLLDIMADPLCPSVWVDIIAEELQKRMGYFSRDDDNVTWDFYTGDSGDEQPEECSHRWKAIIGLTKIYYNCVYCNIKRETYEQATGTNKRGTPETRRGTSDGTAED